MKDELAKAIHAASPYFLQRRGFGGPPSRDKAWGELSEVERDSCLDQAQAVHSFLGVEKGKELERDAVAKLVAALRGLLKAIDYQQKAARATDMKHAMAYEDLVRIEKDKAQVALRAAGEEVSDGG